MSGGIPSAEVVFLSKIMPSFETVRTKLIDVHKKKGKELCSQCPCGHKRLFFPKAALSKTLNNARF